ncbi:MAG: helix-turn-helix domain-containing protein [Clostridia bacterium]|nr:helix-turn-helix domain-containing protein [Clostridia bacterium]
MDSIMNIKELRQTAKMTQYEFANYFGIPFRTIQNWEGGQRTPPQYIVNLIEYKLKKEKHI